MRPRRYPTQAALLDAIALSLSDCRAYLSFIGRCGDPRIARPEIAALAVEAGRAAELMRELVAFDGGTEGGGTDGGD